MALRTHSVPHDLRHTHVALLIDEGEDPYVISRRLGRIPSPHHPRGLREH